MRSGRTVVAALVFLSALPVTALYQAVAGRGAEVVIHLVLAVGAALMAVGVFDFRTARWIAWTGSLALGVLAVIFLLQAVAEMAQHDSLSQLAYQGLGQGIEARAGDLFVLWCAAVVLVDARGWTRIVGAGAVILVAGMRGYAYYLAYRGTSLDVEAPALKLLALLPFIWLLLEGRKTRADA